MFKSDFNDYFHNYFQNELLKAFALGSKMVCEKCEKPYNLPGGMRALFADFYRIFLCPSCQEEVSQEIGVWLNGSSNDE